MAKHNFEGISTVLNECINKQIGKLNSLKNKGMITEKERQYIYLVFLQTLELTDKQVFDIYTNTDFE